MYEDAAEVRTKLWHKLFHLCDTTHSHVWRDSFLRVA